MKKLRVGVVGMGYWGPNIVRNFNLLDNACVAAACDLDEASARKALKISKDILLETDYRKITDALDIDIVCVVTPLASHYEIAKRALEQGKHVFVEKPFTATSREAEELITLAQKKSLLIMVDHTMLFTGAVRKMKDIVKSGILGKLLYYDSMRVNLGLFQRDVNVIWDLAPHDFSIADYLLDVSPVSVSAHGIGHFNGAIEDVAYVVLYFNDNIIAHCNFNWVSPIKVRHVLLAGENKSILWDDLEPDEKVKIYDRGVEVTGREDIYKLLVQYRFGDMLVPKLDNKEALAFEAEYFINSILNNTPVINDGGAGLRIVRLLEACDLSLKKHGELVKV
ncbi:MAG: Gfo/Idh/MocA family oxidoreductase [Candidatus Omnitrophica bacterium]|nr:Gfo/Idh/MocA family oxidoreductase [Candidatus Omnitrophota bacterium]